MDRPEENFQDIRRQLDEAKKEFNQLEMKRGESLRDFEYRVKRHSDKLLSLKVAGQVQRQLIDQEVRDAEEQLKKKELLNLFIVVARNTEPRYSDCLLRRGVKPRKTGGFVHLGETGDSPYGSIFTANPIK